MDRRHTSALYGSREEETAGLLQRSASELIPRPKDANPFYSLPSRDSDGLGSDEGTFQLQSSTLRLMEEPEEDFCLCRRCRTASNLSTSQRPNGRSASRTYSRTWSGVSSGSNVLSVNADVADDVPFLLNDSIQLGSAISDSCRCHVVKPISAAALRARKQLIISSILCVAFMASEIVGGYLSNSLAILTDAAHLLSDLASFLISLFALWFGQKAPTKRMSFGYHRAEILGAVASVLIIWVLTGILVYAAVERIRTNDYEINADAMLVVSGLGVAINIVMGIVLHGFCCGGAHLHSHGIGSSHPHGQGSSHTHGHGHGHSHGSDQNINVRAAFIHVLGDLFQSIGVLVAAYIIKYKPEYKLADPICTFLFSGLVLFTTISIMKDAIYILMEGFPHDLSYPAIIKELQSIQGVKTAHSLHIWSLTTDKKALAVHLAIDPSANSDGVLQEAEAFVRKSYNIYQSTIQVERFVPEVMSACMTCIKGPD